MVDRSIPLSAADIDVRPPAPGGKPATGERGETLKSGYGLMLPATRTTPASPAWTMPKQKRSAGGARGSTTALTRATLAFGPASTVPPDEDPEDPEDDEDVSCPLSVPPPELEELVWSALASPGAVPPLLLLPQPA